MTLHKFSAEVNDLIISAVKDTSDLKNIRMVSKTLSQHATRRLFSKLCITLSGLPGRQGDEEENGDEDDEEHDHTRFNKILSFPTLSKEVRSLRYMTSSRPKKTIEYYNNIMAVINEVNRFPNLTNLAVDFSPVCANIPACSFWKVEVDEPVSFRTKVLNALLAALHDPDQPTPKLQSLSLKNLQNVNHNSVVKSTNFLQLLSRLSELRLKIATEQVYSAPELAWSLPEVHKFFNELPSTWLRPAQSNLTSLTLHMDDYWGYIPKADFRTLEFPQLKKLELGNYTFSHDWQLDWILSLQTLEVLILDDCPIIRYVRFIGPLDHEGYPEPPVHFPGATTISRYNGTWAGYFSKVEDLKRLKKFKFGVGDWQCGNNFDGDGWDAGLHENMYMFFDGSIGPTPWQTWTRKDDEADEEEEGEKDSEQDGSDDGEESDIADSPVRASDVDYEADIAAYNSLMATLAQR